MRLAAVGVAVAATIAMCIVAVTARPSQDIFLDNRRPVYRGNHRYLSIFDSGNISNSEHLQKEDAITKNTIAPYTENSKATKEFFDSVIVSFTASPKVEVSLDSNITTKSKVLSFYNNTDATNNLIKDFLTNNSEHLANENNFESKTKYTTPLSPGTQKESLDNLIVSHTQGPRPIQLFPHDHPDSWTQNPLNSSVILIKDAHPSLLPKPTTSFSSSTKIPYLNKFTTSPKPMVQIANSRPKPDPKPPDPWDKLALTSASKYKPITLFRPINTIKPLSSQTQHSTSNPHPVNNYFSTKRPVFRPAQNIQGSSTQDSTTQSLYNLLQMLSKPQPTQSSYPQGASKVKVTHKPLYVKPTVDPAYGDWVEFSHSEITYTSPTAPSWTSSPYPSNEMTSWTSPPPYKKPGHHYVYPPTAWPDRDPWTKPTTPIYTTTLLQHDPPAFDRPAVSPPHQAVSSPVYVFVPQQSSGVQADPAAVPSVPALSNPPLGPTIILAPAQPVTTPIPSRPPAPSIVLLDDIAADPAPPLADPLDDPACRSVSLRFNSTQADPVAQNKQGCPVNIVINNIAGGAAAPPAGGGGLLGGILGDPLGVVRPILQPVGNLLNPGNQTSNANPVTLADINVITTTTKRPSTSSSYGMLDYLTSIYTAFPFLSPFWYPFLLIFLGPLTVLIFGGLILAGFLFPFILFRLILSFAFARRRRRSINYELIPNALLEIERNLKLGILSNKYD